MDGLLDEMIAREPREIEPVAKLPFHVGHVGLARDHPEAAGVVGRLHGEDVANIPSQDAAKCFAHARVVAPAKAGDERKILLLRFLDRLEHRAHARAIHRDGFLGKDVLAGSHRGGEVHWPKARRRGQDDQVHAAVERFFYGDGVVLRRVLRIVKPT